MPITIQPLPLQAPASGPERWRRLAEAINALIKAVAAIVTGGTVTPGGTWNGTFLSGSIQYNNNGAFGGLGDFQYGLNLPNASGIPGPGLLLAGAGKTQVALICDEQLPGQKGITLIIEAGDASTAGAANDDSGDLLAFAGGTLNGDGGVAKWQGGTSVNARAGDAVLHGGNTTSGIPGDAVCIGGETGPVGANVKLVATKPPGASRYGVIRHQFNSNLARDYYSDGSCFLYGGGGFGLAGQARVSGGPGNPEKWLTAYTGIVTLAKITTGGSNGSLTVASGIITSYSAPT